MAIFSVALLAGTLAAFYIPAKVLSSIAVGVAITAACAAIPFLRRYSVHLFVLGVSVGFSICLHQIDQLRNTWLPESGTQTTQSIVGCIADLVEPGSDRVRFDFVYSPGVGERPRRVRLSWYRSDIVPGVGQVWQFDVRLRPPHGFVNPGGFDYERWLFANHYSATGYIKTGRVVDAPGLCQPFRWNRIRAGLLARLKDALEGYTSRDLILALALGYRGEMDATRWDVLRATGTAHLVAISGLHIGLVSGLVFLVLRYLGARIRLPGSQSANEYLASTGALIAAVVYAALSGFALPARRAAIMVAVVVLARLLNRRTGFTRVLSLTLIVVLLIDPLAVISTGFWLSFGAVLAIALIHVGRAPVKRRYLALLWMQPRLFLMMTPVTVLFFGMAGFTAPLANLVAIPVIGLLVVPMVLVATGLTTFLPTLAKSVFDLADSLLGWVWSLLVWLADIEWLQVLSWSPGVAELLFALIGTGLLLLPRVPGLRLPALAMFMPLLFSQPSIPAEGRAHLSLLDVGQGLATVVRTRRHTLLFDAGPAFRSGFDTGEMVVLPFLATLGVKTIDLMVISHGDLDHRGGANAVLARLPVHRVISGEPDRLPGIESTRCTRGMSWEWDGVSFEMLSPVPGASVSGNNASCVLRIISGNGQAVLLTGDIESATEREMLRDKLTVKADVLVAPHHGSRTSSSTSFIRAVAPRWVLFSAGRYNQWNFPLQDVKRRYRKAGAGMRETGHCGAIRLEIGSEAGSAKPRCERDRYRAWRKDPGDRD